MDCQLAHQRESNITEMFSLLFQSYPFPLILSLTWELKWVELKLKLQYMSNQKRGIALLLDPRAQITKTKEEATLQIPRPLNIDQPPIPMSKVCSLVVTKLASEPFPQRILPADCSIEEASHIHFKDYCKLFQVNQTLNNDLVDAISDRNLLADKYNQIKRMRFSEDAVRRKRRYARDIERVFFCPMEKCNRGYGSEGSLSHHVRLKHLDFYESGKYEIFIQNYLDNKLPEIMRKLQQKQKEREKRPLIRQRATTPQLIVGKKRGKKQDLNHIKQEQ